MSSVLQLTYPTLALQGGGSLNIGKKTQPPPAATSSPLAAIRTEAQLIAALKPMVHACLMDFHPQGLTIDGFPSEFENKYEQPLPLHALGRDKVKVRDLLDLLADVVAIVPGVQQSNGRPGKDRVVARDGSVQSQPLVAEPAVPAPPMTQQPQIPVVQPARPPQPLPAATPQIPSFQAAPIASAGGAQSANGQPKGGGGAKKRGGELESVLRDRVLGLLARNPKGLSATKIEEGLADSSGKKVHLGKDSKDRKAFLVQVCGLREDNHRERLLYSLLVRCRSTPPDTHC